MLAGMGILGQVLLAVIFSLCGFAVVFSLVALKKSMALTAKKILDRVMGVMLAAAGLSIVVLILLISAFLIDNFSIDIVRRYSSIELPICYKISALWAGSTGSFLLWSVGVFIAFALWLMADANKQLAVSNLKFNAIALAIGAGVCLTFTALLIFFAKPFASGNTTVGGGIELNPLLQNFWIFIRQPLLFTAYSAFLIPFVIILAAVFAGRAGDPEIYYRLKPWLLIGICFLSAGIAAGARWSYIELGGGSFWSWDPVENILLLLWFVGMAALHSLIGIRIADKFRFWTIILAPLPFILCLFIAFIMRSGILISLYSFTGTVSSLALSVFIGCCFLLWLICIIVFTAKSGSISLLKASGFHLDKREVLFWANVIFIFTAAVIGVTTFCPVIWQDITGSDSVAMLPPLFYNHVVLMAAIILVFLVGCATLIDLQERHNFILQLLGCCAAGLLCFGLVLKFGQVSFLLTLTCGVCAFSFVAVLVKLALSLKQTGQIAGGVAHLGLLLLVVAACFSSDRLSIQTILNEKGSLGLDKYELFYKSFKRESFAGVIKEGPEIVITKENLQRKFWPHRCLYSDGRKVDEVAVHMGLLEDIFISFDRLNRAGSVIITAKIKPFMLWLWLAAALVVGGLALGLFGKKS